MGGEGEPENRAGCTPKEKEAHFGGGNVEIISDAGEPGSPGGEGEASDSKK